MTVLTPVPLVRTLAAGYIPAIRLVIAERAPELQWAEPTPALQHQLSYAIQCSG